MPAVSDPLREARSRRAERRCSSCAPTGAWRSSLRMTVPGPVNETASFEPFASGPRLRCIAEPVRGTVRGVVLLLPPFAEEMNKSRRMCALLARGLAADGWRVVRIDLFGCGDSAGSLRDASWEQWCDDLRTELHRHLSGVADALALGSSRRSPVRSRVARCRAHGESAALAARAFRPDALEPVSSPARRSSAARRGQGWRIESCAQPRCGRGGRDCGLRTAARRRARIAVGGFRRSGELPRPHRMARGLHVPRRATWRRVAACNRSIAQRGAFDVVRTGPWRAVLAIC